ncbi:unnamed protein product [Schistosoma margrebowiei]|uniref:Uncharacterized protein n=1 Tax=Schistosoma margrebowiei TaxID=48269 RepID=A0A183MAE2_9TREM|nr:unnamed protein product [Schistosoma margrebowiei]
MIAQTMRRPILPMFIPVNKYNLSSHFNGWSGITRSLPNNIHLLSLTSWPLNIVDKSECKKQLLVRFENLHTLDYSEYTQIDVTYLFYSITIIDVTEMILTADRFKEDATLHRLHWPTEPISQCVVKTYEMNSSSIILKLPPDKIMTYLLSYKINDST